MSLWIQHRWKVRGLKGLVNRGPEIECNKTTHPIALWIYSYFLEAD